MQSEQNTIQEGTGRWLRIGTLTLTPLTPFLNSIASLMPKRAALVIDKDDIQAASSDLDARIKAELTKRHMQQFQKERRQHRLQQVATTSRKKIQDLMAAAELSKRGRQVRRTLQKQNRKFQKKWQRQFQQQQKGKRTFWIALGFGFGLALAGIISYQYLRHRLQQRKEEEAALELAYTEIGSQNGNVTNAIPPDAVFVGIISTKLYYPIETPLDQLPTKDDRPVDVLFFASEQEASNQGFQPAQSHLPTAPSHS
jgi:hypothetical protein